jgi:hypothetical protein
MQALSFEERLGLLVDREILLECDNRRKRHILPWPYLAQVIAERRKGHSAPPLPAAS